MLEVIAATFPGSRLRVESGQIVGPLQFEGQFHSLRLRLEPFVEIFLDLPPLDGFELRIQWGDRWIGDEDIGDPRVDDAYFIRTNDLALAKMWLDERGRAALVTQRERVEAFNGGEHARIRERRRRDAGDFSEPNLRRAWTIELEKTRMSSTLGLGKAAANDEVLATIETMCAIAGASGRWAQKCSELALLTGTSVKQVADRVELGATALLLEQQRVDVEVRYVRSDEGESARLSTRVRGNRITQTTATWSVLDDDAPRGPIPEPTTGDKLRAPRPLRHLQVRCSTGDTPPFAVLEPLFLRETDKALAVIASTTSITVWFDGAVLAAEPIAIAARVIAQLASDAGLAEGPYR